MPIADLQQAAQQIASFLNSVIRLGGLRLKYRVSASAAPEDAETAGAQVLNVELAGPDAPMLTQRGGELLRSLEHIAIQILRLDVREHDLVSFDALNFKALRQQEIQLSAETAAERVRQSGTALQLPALQLPRTPHPASRLQKHGRRRIRLLGEGQERYLVVYPKGPRPLLSSCFVQLAATPKRVVLLSKAKDLHLQLPLLFLSVIPAGNLLFRPPLLP
jgi:spoIIIJ-associated protein